MATTEKHKMLTAICRDLPSTERAFDWLQERGYAAGEISVLMSERTRKGYHEKGTEGQIKTSSHAMEGVAAGGAVGTVVGVTVGALLALGTTVAGPFGWIIAGPIVAGLVGGGAGAVTGGAVGGLVGLGIPESNAAAYEEALKKGGVVFGVHPHSSADAKAIRECFEELKADNIVYA